MPVATAKVEGRRKLDYQSLDEVVADAERLSAGTLTTLGNWSAGQIFPAPGYRLQRVYRRIQDNISMADAASWPGYSSRSSSIARCRLVSRCRPGLQRKSCLSRRLRNMG